MYGTMAQFALQGRVAVVTGGTGLIGQEHCRALLDAGAKVVLADVNMDLGPKMARDLGSACSFYRIDVADASSVQVACDQIENEIGPVSVLVNNAAINDMFENPTLAGELSKFENYPLEMWDRMWKVNVSGAFLMSQVFGSKMASRRKGSIINIASTYGVVAPDQSLYRDRSGKQEFYKSPAYPVTKGAVIALTKFMAAYWGDKGVRVNTLSPGGVFNGQDDFFVENYSSRTPLGRMARPMDYRGAIVFLASDASSYMTGANLIVDGGWTCR